MTLALGRRHARRRLVEQQDTRLERQGDGDLHQALPAIGELAHRAQRMLRQPQAIETGDRLGGKAFAQSASGNGRFATRRRSATASITLSMDG